MGLSLEIVLSKTLPFVLFEPSITLFSKRCQNIQAHRSIQQNRDR
jgi:hypothetical protein